MKRYLPVAFLIVGCLPAIGAAQSDNSAKSTAATVGAGVKELAADLKEARELTKKVTDKAIRDRLELLITRSELKAVEIEKALSGLSNVQPSVPPISAEDFAKLLKGIKAEAFDEGKVGFVTTFAAKGRLNCDQARELLKTFSFDEGRGRAAVALYPALTDPQRFFTVLEVFTFEAGRNSVREKLKLNGR